MNHDFGFGNAVIEVLCVSTGDGKYKVPVVCMRVSKQLLMMLRKIMGLMCVELRKGKYATGSDRSLERIANCSQETCIDKSRGR